jgi:DNA polymerase elongation subunit (family B)
MEIGIDIETTGLSPLKHRVTCIGYSDEDGLINTITNQNEAELIEMFLYQIVQYRNETLITYNGKSFDIPFILIRAYFSGIPVEQSGFLSRMKHYDIMKDYFNKFISLENALKWFGIEPKSGNGLKAIQLWEEGRIAELEDYCRKDVDVTLKLMNRIKEVQKL